MRPHRSAQSGENVAERLRSVKSVIATAAAWLTRQRQDRPFLAPSQRSRRAGERPQ
jgi:hypothetical protein